MAEEEAVGSRDAKDLRPPAQVRAKDLPQSACGTGQQQTLERLGHAIVTLSSFNDAIRDRS